MSKDREYIDLLGDGTPEKYANPEINDKKQEGPSYLEIAKQKMSDIPNKKFKETAFGRTLLLKNKTGKIGVTVLAGAGATLLPGPIGGWLQQGVDVLTTIQTGTDMEALLDFNITQLIIMAVAFLIAWALPSIWPGLKEKQVWNIINDRLDEVADEVVHAVDKDSEGGKKITRTEWRSIIGSALKKDDST